MKVGIVTVYDSSNIGSYLQALGMQELVKANGDEPYFIMTRSEFSVLCLFMGYNNAPCVRSLHGFVRFLLRCFMHLENQPEKLKKYKKYKTDRNKLEHIISLKQANKMGLDAIILGSDEIWNSNHPAFRNPLLYGAGIKAKKKYAYAISAGNMELENWQKYPELIRSIKALDVIVPRDIRTAELLEAHGITTQAIVCDPTLQVDIKSYMTNSCELPDGDYMVIYAYSVNENMIRNIIRFASEHSLRTVAVSLPNDWCDEYVNCSPLEFGSVLSHAKYVYTSTFHGTIFSALYHTNFVSMNNLPKVEEVIKVMRMEDAAVCQDCGYEEFSQKLLRKRDYNKFEETIRKLKTESKIAYEKMMNNDSVK